MRYRLFLATTAVLCVGVFVASAAHSAPESFSFDVDGTQGVFGGPGTTLLLGQVAVGASLVGRSCQITLDAHNNDSVREGTDLVVGSNGVTVTATNVEHRVGDAAPAFLGKLVLGPSVTVSLRFGPEGAASVAATVIVDCPDVPTTSTPPTTTLAPTAAISPGTAITPGRPSVAGVVAVQPRFTG
jgi:hypothetical protein